MAIALTVWLVTAKAYLGAITVEALGHQWVSFAGNAAAIVSGGILSIGLSLWRPANFDWEIIRGMTVIKDEELSPSSTSTSTQSLSDSVKDEKFAAEAKEERQNVDVEAVPAKRSSAEEDGLDIPELNRTFKVYTIAFSALAFIITFVSFMTVFVVYASLTVPFQLIPGPLGGAPYIFSRTFFKAYIGIMFVSTFGLPLFYVNWLMVRFNRSGCSSHSISSLFFLSSNREEL